MKAIIISIAFGMATTAAALPTTASPTTASASPKPTVPGDLCDYDDKQLTCSQDLTTVYSCNQTTNVWEHLWKCEYPGHCVENGSFCVIDWPPPPVEQWGDGHEHGHGGGGDGYQTGGEEHGQENI